jgi:hypothetical protein
MGTDTTDIHMVSVLPGPPIAVRVTPRHVVVSRTPPATPLPRPPDTAEGLLSAEDGRS